MNGENRKVDPIDRPISPATISSTSPDARMANGAKNGSSVTKLPCVKKRSVFSVKYAIASRVTTMMLPSRSVRNRRATLSPPAPPAKARSRRPPTGSPADAWPGGLALLISLGLGHADRGAAALEARLGRVVGHDGGLVEELQAGVDVGHAPSASP